MQHFQKILKCINHTSSILYYTFMQSLFSALMTIKSKCRSILKNIENVLCSAVLTIQLSFYFYVKINKHIKFNLPLISGLNNIHTKEFF